MMSLSEDILRTSRQVYAGLGNDIAVSGRVAANRLKRRMVWQSDTTSRGYELCYTPITGILSESKNSPNLNTCCNPRV